MWEVTGDIDRDSGGSRDGYTHVGRVFLSSVMILVQTLEHTEEGIESCVDGLLVCWREAWSELDQSLRLIALNHKGRIPLFR